jgi:ribosomal protein S18 acetylase RimI-like enzyme
MTHVLGRPVWHALSTRHAQHSIGADRARRFVPDISPLAGARDDDAASLAALAELIPVDGSVLLLQADPIVVPPNCVALKTADGVQMVLDTLVDLPMHDVVELNESDYPAMLALATLTRPGPFASRTPALGKFVGVKENGILIAMAGERLKHEGFTEVSGVCTHPDARGRGLARALSHVVARRIVERGETPYLHSYASNTAAIRLYESLGFRIRSKAYVAELARAP